MDPFQTSLVFISSFLFAFICIPANVFNNIFHFLRPLIESWRYFYSQRLPSGRCFPLWYCEAANDEVGSGLCENNTAEWSRWRQSAIKTLYFSLHSRGIPDYLLQATSECLVEQSCSLSQWPETSGRLELKSFFLAKQKGYTLYWLEVPAIYTCLSQVPTENLLKARDGWGSKKFMPRVPSSYDLTVEAQDGCSTCGRISGALAAMWNIAGAHSPKHESIG